LEYRVLTFHLTNAEYEELRDRVAPKAQFTQSLGGGGFTPHYDFFFQAKVLLPIAGAIGKSVLDVIADRVKEWLKHRPEDRTVEIYGPDNSVVSVVKKGREIDIARRTRSLGPS
jgi:hypothetical protein